MSDLTSTDDVKAAMLKLDAEIAACGRPQNRKEFLIIKSLKRRRVELQDLLGKMNRDHKAANQKRIEAAFMQAAYDVLPRNQVSKIWDRAHELNPWLTNKESVPDGAVDSAEGHL